MLNEIRKASRSQCWWEAPINELGLHELEKLKTAMEDVKKNVEQQANKILINSKNNPSPFFGVNNENINLHHHQSRLPLQIRAPSNDALPNFYNSGFGHYHDHQQ